MVLIAVQSTLTVILAVLILISAIASCVHKRKPAKIPRNLDDDPQSLRIPVGDNVSELERLSTRKGYFHTSTSEKEDSVHRVSTLELDPYVPSQSPAPKSEEYSSIYGGSVTSYSTASKKPSMGHRRVGSVGYDSQLHPIGGLLDSPPVLETTPQGYS